jgi:hypothetical protein
MPTQVQEPDVERRAAQEPSRTGRRRPWPLLLGAVAATALVALTWRAVDLLPTWENPLRQEVTESSTAPLMLALDDLSEYHAATGTFQVVVDRERDTRYVPSFISGERTSLLATGSVDAVVDFTGLGADAVRVSPDGRAVTFSLPAPSLGQVRVDPDNSRVLDRDRGVLDRVGGMFEDNPSPEGELYALAEERLAGAAAQSDLLDRAETNTRGMLTALARSLGFAEVTVTFDAPTT